LEGSFLFVILINCNIILIMDIAVTGGSGRLGQVVIDHLIAQGHTVRSLDRALSQRIHRSAGAIRTLQVDLTDLPAVTGALRSCEAVVHLAAYPGPHGQPPGVVYANNTLASYNVLSATASLGIRHICLASSVNAIGGIGSRAGRYDYFPVDEEHPTYNEDDYSLGKWVMEQQAGSFARRFPEVTLSSLRFHGLPDTPPEPQRGLEGADGPAARTLWGWTLIGEAARACELALQAGFTGHEVFFITAPRTTSSVPSLELARHAYPRVPLRGNLSGHRSFYDCSKAARLLGWVHSA
jgi:UDP-glucose 4-epimerase